MTREEAIKILMDGELNPCVAEDREACDMAIKALEQESMENFESVKDHIFKLAGDYKCWDNRLTYDEALELCHILEQQPCDDCISRQAVLDCLTATGLKKFDFILDTRDKIKNLPPVIPKPKMGRWIDEGFYAEGHNEHAYRCSECDEQYIGYVGEFKHCPNCGAKMESRDKE